MSVSYLDTLFTIAQTEGLVYGKITKAMRVHVRSLVADGYAASFAADESQTTLDDPEGIVWLSDKGAEYLSVLVDAGLVADPATAPKPARQPKARKRTSRRPSAPKPQAAVVPSPTESVQVPTPASLPKPTKVTVVPPKAATAPSGQAFNPSPSAQVQPEAESTITTAERFEALEGRVDTVLAALEILVGSVK